MMLVLVLYTCILIIEFIIAINALKYEMFFVETYINPLFWIYI